MQKCFLPICLFNKEKEAIESMKLERLTGNTDLIRNVKRIIDKGYSTDFAEADEGIHCIAGPIFNPDLTLAGTLWSIAQKSIF